ncbi:unnamed protein product [Macrosiphum euphorbiae]|uniref:CCHC-type domain-containing protein n=1 Tax=Macrosiphum euphorbiae TaxID=13131 RepID=A0AAV0WXQ2_9HEMI|nr:unnamed protein product [Macrosiphum euphorbiae]
MTEPPQAPRARVVIDILSVLLSMRAPLTIPICTMYMPRTNNNIPCRLLTKILRAPLHHYSPTNLCVYNMFYNRFCVFFKNQQITNDIIKKHSAIFIDNIEVPIRKLINPAKRIILSNVYQAIPNKSIIEAIETYGIKITSPITALKDGFPLDQFTHITSFRRQLYISPEDFPKLPGSISLDNTSYLIFITDDIVTCFLCKKPGHVSSSCKMIHTTPPLSENMDTSNEQTSTNISSHHIVEKTNRINASSELPLEITSEISNKNNAQITHDDNYDDISDTQSHQATFKRPAPESTCPSAPPSPTLTNDQIEFYKDTLDVKNTNPKKQTTKKIKVRSRSNSSTRTTEILDNLLEPATAILQNKDSSLNLITFKYILENFTNKNLNIHELCISVGSNATEVLDMAEKVLPLMVEKKN